MGERSWLISNTIWCLGERSWMISNTIWYLGARFWLISNTIWYVGALLRWYQIRFYTILSYHDESDSPWSYHVIAWSSCLTMAVNPGAPLEIVSYEMGLKWELECFSEKSRKGGWVLEEFCSRQANRDVRIEDSEPE